MNVPAYQLLRQGAPYIEHQERRGFAVWMDSAEHLHGCALGAIAIAAEDGLPRGRPARNDLPAIRKTYLELLRTPRAATQPCPGRGWWPWQGRCWTCDKVTRLGNQVAHLNDRHGWSFDRIADWLRREHPDWLVPVQPARDGASSRPEPGVALPHRACHSRIPASSTSQRPTSCSKTRSRL